MKFPRPRHRNTGPPPRRVTVVQAAPDDLQRPQPELNGTFAGLVGLVITSVLAKGDLPSSLARAASIGALLSLCASMLLDIRHRGIRNLVRTDVMAILSFYFLTFFEFLFPQPNFDEMVTLATAHDAILCVNLGFAGLLIGRHLVHPKKQPFAYTLTYEIPPKWNVVIFWSCFFIGYLHMLIAVNFNVIDMVGFFLEQRFSQPWARGRLGDWKALIGELGLFIYLIPPLGGIMFARRQRYGSFTLFLVCLAVLFTFFYGFSSGTRNIFASYLVTFLIAYSFAMPFARKKELVLLCAGSALVTIFAAYFMLQFRNAGLRAYLTGEYVPPQSDQRTMFVDYNLFTIAGIIEAFPAKHAFLGWETPYMALIRPIPRAIWPGKPEGLSVTMEEVFNAQGLTLGASFVGESYMSGGYPVVAVIALCFGMLTGWWNFLASSKNSELGILIYASGFFATVISMRSLFVFTTALLPTVAALIIGTYAVRIFTSRARQLISRATQPRRRLPPQPRR